MKILRLLPLLALAALTSMPLHAASMSEPTPAPSATVAKPRLTPFHGTVSGVDDQSKSFTLTSKTGGIRTFIMGADSKVMDGEKAATFADIKSGSMVRGSAMKMTENGKYTVSKVTLGEKPAPTASASPKPKKAKKAAAAPTP